MGWLSQAFGFSGSGNQENDSHVPPSRRQPPDKAEKERLRRHYEDQEKQLDDNEPRDGKLW